MNRALKRVLAAAVVAAAFGLALLAGAILLNRVPLTAPPGLWVRLHRYLGRHVAQTAPDSPLPELRTRHYARTPQALFTAVQAALRRLGWAVTERDAARRELRAVVVTPLLRFRDDILIRVNAGAGHTSSLYLNSRSRVGRGDLGANIRHILDLYAALRPPSEEPQP